jgi:hypothetical protein
VLKNKGETIMAKAPPIVPSNMVSPKVNFSKEAINSAIEMKCLNKIKYDDTDKTKTCDGVVFVEAARLKYISPIMSPTGQQTIATINVGKLCITCGAIFNPDQWLKKHSEEENAVKGTILDKNGKATG